MPFNNFINFKILLKFKNSTDSFFLRILFLIYCRTPTTNAPAPMTSDPWGTRLCSYSGLWMTGKNSFCNIIFGSITTIHGEINMCMCTIRKYSIDSDFSLSRKLKNIKEHVGELKKKQSQQLKE